MSHIFIFKNTTKGMLYGMYSKDKLNISGNFYCGGKQEIGVGIPLIIGDIFKSDNNIDTIAISGTNGSAVYSRLKEG